MKLLKKLIPLSALASTAIVAAPFVSSCSKSVSVTSLDWKPSSQHKQETITMNYSDLTQYKELSKDYFESDSSKHFKEDICYTEIEQISNALEALKKTDGVSDANVIFTITVSDVNLTAQDAKIAEITFPGYKASFKISIDSVFTWKKTEINKGDYSRIEYDYKTVTSTIETVTDFFAYLSPVSTPSNTFRYRVCSYDNNNWKDIISFDTQVEAAIKYVFADGNTHYVTSSNNETYCDEYTKSKIAQKDIISDKSYYLANVTHN